jgi:predicted nuclease of predicted toxin-antitoxin system
MKPKRERKANKPRFVVDHNTSFTHLKQTYGGLATFISSVQLTGKQDATDPEIIKFANENDYHIITLNTKDFEDAPRQYAWLKIGIIAVNLKEKNYRTKFNKILRAHKKHENFYNKLIILGNTIRIFNYSTLRA